MFQSSDCDHTFPLDKVAHARVAIKHLLCDIAHNFTTLLLAVKRVPEIRGLKKI
jgi:hypothetical protein